MKIDCKVKKFKDKINIKNKFIFFIIRNYKSQKI